MRREELEKFALFTWTQKANRSRRSKRKRSLAKVNYSTINKKDVELTPIQHLSQLTTEVQPVLLRPLVFVLCR